MKKFGGNNCPTLLVEHHPSSRHITAISVIGMEHPFRSSGSGRSLTAARGRPMAFKWSKASRAKLNRSQKARWKERKTIGSALNVPPDSGDVVLHKPMRYTP